MTTATVLAALVWALILVGVFWALSRLLGYGLTRSGLLVIHADKKPHSGRGDRLDLPFWARPKVAVMVFGTLGLATAGLVLFSREIPSKSAPIDLIGTAFSDVSTGVFLLGVLTAIVGGTTFLLSRPRWLVANRHLALIGIHPTVATSKASGADVFLSYSREDFEAAKKISDFLRSRGLSVFSDQDIRAGEDWQNSMTKMLVSAKSVVALCSSHSVQSKSLLDEASFGLARRTLVIARLDKEAKIPLSFAPLHINDLLSLSSHSDARPSEFEPLLSDIRRTISAPRDERAEAQ
jgi:hypothetical protein